jgi:tRNA(fMet)-specific endonuclease VapC
MQALRDIEEVFLSPIVIGELRSGFLNGNRRRQNEELLSRFIAKPSVKMLRLDAETSERYAEIHHQLRQTGRPLPINDIWIAASAMQLGARVLTTDEHFLSIPQILTTFVPAQ